MSGSCSPSRLTSLAQLAPRCSKRPFVHAVWRLLIVVSLVLLTAFMAQVPL